MIHTIKILEQFADAVFSGEKPFEVRKNDRAYQHGDTIKFKVFEEGAAFLLPRTAHPLNDKEYMVTYVLSGWGVQDGYVVLGIKPVDGGDHDA